MMNKIYGSIWEGYERQIFIRLCYIDLPLRPVNRETTNRTRKTKNKIFARPAAAATRLKKPKIPAMIAMTSRIADHFNIAYHHPFFD